MALCERGNVSLTVLEAERHLAAHQTGNNCGVIHSGLYYKPGSLKAKNCTEGRQAMYEFCAEGIVHENSGKVIVAIQEASCLRSTASTSAALPTGWKGCAASPPRN